MMQKRKTYHAIRQASVIFAFGVILLVSACTSSRSNQEAEQQDLVEVPPEPAPAMQQQAEEQQRAQAQALAYRNAITAVLGQGAEIGKQYSGNPAAIATALRQLDALGCPRDFAVALLENIQAWEDLAGIQQALNHIRSDDNVKEVAGMEIIQRLFGAEASALDHALEWEKKLTAASIDAGEKIHNTYKGLERIAVAYGATLPQTH
jgi:hypothetical protein